MQLGLAGRTSRNLRNLSNRGGRQAFMATTPAAARPSVDPTITTAQRRPRRVDVINAVAADRHVVGPLHSVLFVWANQASFSGTFR
ncbi:hypothetical protein, partial [Micromonospora sp. NPDC050200]|uniref:hypothetical protein n=1 Tax=Micromonospora sp. NPDC050200 TaxID=3155664 RepID=UPI0033D3DB88